MGFYGNISNAQKNSSFTFDKIYSNRKQMEENALTDGIFVGRFVLVEYDQVYSSNVYKRAYYNGTLSPFSSPFSNEEGKKYYILFANEESSEIINFTTNNETIQNDIITQITLNTPVYTIENQSKYNYNCVGYILRGEEGIKLYKYTSDIGTVVNLTQPIPQGVKIAVFEKLGKVGDFDFNSYETNYNIDKVAYPDQLRGRGWDSTVWQKTSVNGLDKYVMIAELNSVVPSFALKMDAPTSVPKEPYFDEKSTNVYYELHWQPQWGFRVASAKGIGSINENGIVEPGSEDNRILSDEDTTWIKEVYNKTTGKNELYYFSSNNEWVRIDSFNDLASIENAKLPAAIYYNKAGFEKGIRYHSSLDDKLNVEMSGKSGIAYDGANSVVDTQELSIILPSLGNAVSDMWDIVYGRGISENEEFLDDKSYNRAMDIAWREDPVVINDSKRLSYLTNDKNYLTAINPNPDGIETVAGSINTLHDILGMIIQQPEDQENIDLATFVNQTNEDRIYYINNKFYRKAKIEHYNSLVEDEDIFYISFLDDDFNQSELIVSRAQLVENKIYYKKENDNTYTLLVEADFEDVENGSLEYFVKKTKATGKKEVELKSLKDLADGKDLLYKSSNGFDYLYEEKYNKGRKYYTANETYIEDFSSQINNSYEKGKFWIKNDIDEDYILDEELYAQSSTEYKIDLREDLIPVSKNDIFRIGDEVYLPKTITQGEGYNFEGYRIFNSSSQEDRNVITSDDFPTAFKRKIPVTSLDQLKEGRKICYQSKRNEDEKRVINGNTYSIYYTNFDSEKKLFKYSNSEYRLVSSPEERYEFLEGERPILITTLKDVPGEFISLNMDNINYQLGVEEGSNQFGIIVVNPMTTNSEVPPTLSLLYEMIDVTFTKKPVGYIKYYIKSENNKKLTKIGSSEELNSSFTPNTLYYFKNEPERFDNLYQPGVYYLCKDKSWILDKSGPYDAKDTYYKLNSDLAFEFRVIDESDIYTPGLYYYESDGQYLIDHSLDPVEGRQYYTISNQYNILADSQGMLKKYSSWNSDLPVPENVTLGSWGGYDYVLKEMEGFGRTMNTVHGLILQINNFLERGNYETRDESTVQGALNKLNDIIDKFQVLGYGQFLITDNYGTVRTAPYQGDKWIQPYIIPNFANPSVRVEHKFTPAESGDTTSELNLNNPIKDTLDLYTPKVDEMGHVVGKDIKTITLPYGFKKITISENANLETDMVHSQGEVEAETTQDTLTIKSNNKWIRIAADAHNDAITLAHEIHDIDKTANTSQDLNSESGGNVTIPTVTCDSAGHVTSIKDTDYTLPFGIKTITADSGSFSAENVVDSFSIKTGDNWLTSSIANDELTLTHNAPQNATVIKGNDSNQSPSFGGSFKTLYAGIDEKGHVKTIEERSITLPKPSLSDTTSGNVITSVILTDTTGAFTLSRANIGGLSLNEYNVASASENIAVTDTVGAALGKLEYKLNILNGEESVNGSVKKSLKDAKDYADSLASNYDAAGSANAALTSANSYTDGLKGNLVEGEENTTLKTLLDKITELENRIAVLETPVTPEG